MCFFSSCALIVCSIDIRLLSLYAHRTNLVNCAPSLLLKALNETMQRTGQRSERVNSSFVEYIDGIEVIELSTGKPTSCSYFHDTPEFESNTLA